MVEFLREDISRKVRDLGGTELESLMIQLLIEECRLCEVKKPSESGGEVNHSDGGCDYWTYRAKKPSRWLGKHEICWQFKAKEALSARYLKKEIKKEYPQQALKRGGYYSFVTNKKNGNQQKNRIIKFFRDAYPQYAENIIVYLLDDIVNFCYAHPAIVFKILRIFNFQSVEGPHSWSVMKEHDARKIPWEEDDLRKKAGQDIENLFDQRNFEHVHIRGEPGVGKTRFALEVCKKAKWKNRVLYGLDFSSSIEKDIRELIDLKSDMILAIDEINDTEKLNKLRRICDSHENIKLLTIGCAEIDSNFSKSFFLEVVSEEHMARIVDRWYGRTYDSKFSNYVARWVGGYVRLAWVFASGLDKLIKDGKNLIAIKDLLIEKVIKQSLKKLYSEEDIYSLHACSLLRIMGFKNQVEIEAKTVINHLSMKWEDFLIGLKKLKTHHIVQQEGNYLYVTPKLLAVYIAMDAWEIYGDNKIYSLAAKLGQEANKRFAERLSEISQSMPDFAKKKLYKIETIDDFLTKERCYFWQAFANADPLLAINKLKEVLLNASIKQKTQLTHDVRQILISTTSYYVAKEELSDSSMTVLAELAASENTSWTNNAIGEFSSNFQFFNQQQNIFDLYFGVLEKIIKKSGFQYIKVSLLALEGSIKTTVNRAIPSERPMVIAWQEDRLEPDENARVREHFLFVLEKINEMLPDIIDKIKDNDDLRPPFLSFLSKVTNLFRYKTLRAEAKKIFENCSPIKVTMREDIRKMLFNTAQWIRKFDDLTDEKINWIDNLYSQFQDTSLKGRIREVIVTNRWDYEGEGIPEPVKDIAQEIFRDRKTMQEEWSWLTSGAAHSANELGIVLAELDKKNSLINELPKFPNRGENWLLLINYYIQKGFLLGDDWLNDWMLTYAEKNPEDRRLPLAVAMYGKGSDNKAKFVMQSLSQGIEPQNFPWLVTIIGFWSQGLSYKISKKIIEFLAEKSEYRAIALELLFHRLRRFSGEKTALDNSSEKETIICYEDVALFLVTDVKIVRQEYEERASSTDYAWQKLSEMLMKESGKYETEIATTIFAACLPELVNGKFSYSENFVPFIGRDYVFSVLKFCAEKNWQSVWQSLLPCLQSENAPFYAFFINAYKFSSIFNKHLKPTIVLNWIDCKSDKKDMRVDLVSGIIRDIFCFKSIAIESREKQRQGYDENALNENYLAVKMLENYPDNENVFSTFYSNLTCGTFWGNQSVRIQEITDELKEIEQKTNNATIKHFITKSVPMLEDQKNYEKEREKERKLLYGF